MTNAQIAEVFEMIGKMLDLRGENVFRVRAYMRAAQMIAALPREMKDMYDDGGMEALREIPGIGADLSAKIAEMVTTGKLKYLEELRKKIPKGLFAVMEVEGMGPKKTKMVWDALGVTSLEDLEKAGKDGKLAALPRWGDRSAAKVLAAIQSKRALGTRIPLPAALALAEALVEALRAKKLCKRIEIAGSLRRRRETIGDIDILAASKRPEAVMEAFGKLPGVKRMIAKGPTKSSVELPGGMQADLRVVEAEVFGAAWHYFTGSKEHNVRLRSMAVQRGITISEYGVYRGTPEKKGKRLASASEEELYGVLKLPWIPPELRENRGEIEAAMKGKLPELIEESDLRGDLHLHSDFSDGSASMIEMARAAKAKGLRYIAITDHGSGMGMVRGLKKENLKEYLKKIEAARKAVPGIRIFAGVEVDIQEDGRLYLQDSVLRELDWVVASVHQHLHQTSEESTKRLLRALENPYVSVIGHPTARLLLKRPGVEFNAEKVFKAAAERGVAMEINASISRLDLSDIHAKMAKDLGVKLTINSDAHAAEELDYRFGISQARRGWLEAGDVINAWPLRTVEEWMNKRS